MAAIDSLSGRPVRLFDPRTENWTGHFSLVGPVIEPLSAIGLATTRILRMKAVERVRERRLLQSLGMYPRRWRDR